MSDKVRDEMINALLRRVEAHEKQITFLMNFCDTMNKFHAKEQSESSKEPLPINKMDSCNCEFCLKHRVKVLTPIEKYWNNKHDDCWNDKELSCPMCQYKFVPKQQESKEPSTNLADISSKLVENFSLKGKVFDTEFFGEDCKVIALKNVAKAKAEILRRIKILLVNGGRTDDNYNLAMNDAIFILNEVFGDD